jgi:uncharacterized DUF497 family protein
MRYTWDCAKNETNIIKHGVSFEQAIKVFADSNALDIFDDIQSEWEERFITIGLIPGGLVLVVWIELAEDLIRIISARRTSKQETRRYYEQIERQSE